MTVNEFMKKYYVTEKIGGRIFMLKRPMVFCKDGFSVSVQANECCYCCPLENLISGFSEVELGFPSEADDLIMDYSEDPSIPTETVYAYVPIETVDELLEKHGGIDEENKEFLERLDKMKIECENSGFNYTVSWK